MSSMQLAAAARKVPLSNRPAMLYKHIIRYVFDLKITTTDWKEGQGNHFDIPLFPLTFNLLFLHVLTSHYYYHLTIICRGIYREVPRIMMIYDIMDKPVPDVRRAIRNHFYKYQHIQDDRVINMLLETGYYHLEDTLQQHKQKNHLMNMLDGYDGNDVEIKNLTKQSTTDEVFYRGF